MRIIRKMVDKQETGKRIAYIRFGRKKKYEDIKLILDTINKLSNIQIKTADDCSENKFEIFEK